METNITQFFKSAAPRDYSASVAEIGNNAGADTWRAACDDAPGFPLLDTPEKREAFIEYARDSGFGDDENWPLPDYEIDALFLQWIAGDASELFPNARTLDALTPDDWAAAELAQSEGQAPSSIYRGDDGQVYFYAGS